MPEEFASIPWYPSEAEYESFRRSAVDAEDFFQSFEQWRRAAVDHQLRAEQAGVLVIRIRMIYKRFEVWRAENKLQNDHAGRSRFAETAAESILVSRPS